MRLPAKAGSSVPPAGGILIPGLLAHAQSKMALKNAARLCKPTAATRESVIAITAMMEDPKSDKSGERARVMMRCPVAPPASGMLTARDSASIGPPLPPSTWRRHDDDTRNTKNQSPRRHARMRRPRTMHIPATTHIAGTIHMARPNPM